MVVEGWLQTFLCCWSGNVHQCRNGREYCLLIWTRETLDSELHPIVLHEVGQVVRVEAAVTDASHSKLYHLLIALLSHHVEKQVKNVETSEVLIVDGVIGKVGQISKNLQLVFCVVCVYV